MKNNQRRNQYRSIRNNSEQTDQKKKGVFEFLKESVALLSAGAGIFTVLLYLAGRSFASGYFGAMNIPSYLVSFSIWEYGEVAWLPMLIYPSIIFGSSALIGWGISSLWEWLSLHVGFFSKWSNDKKSLNKNELKNSQIWLLIVMLSVLILLTLPIISGTLHFVNRWGELEGLLYIAKSSPEVDFVSKIPLNLQSSKSRQENYYYEKLYLLTFNNGKYYIFKDIDQSTCKPIKVTVVSAENLIQIDIKKPAPFEDKCSQKLPKGILDVLKFVTSPK